MQNNLKEYCNEMYNIKAKTIIALIAVSILVPTIVVAWYYAI